MRSLQLLNENWNRSGVYLLKNRRIGFDDANKLVAPASCVSVHITHTHLHIDCTWRWLLDTVAQPVVRVLKFKEGIFDDCHWFVTMPNWHLNLKYDEHNNYIFYRWLIAMCEWYTAHSHSLKCWIFLRQTEICNNMFCSQIAAMIYCNQNRKLKYKQLP